MANALGCKPYHAKFESKDSSLDSWLDGEERLMVATGALGTGVDVPGIQLVVHVGRPRGIIDFVQEVGRAGRSGERVRSVVVMEKGKMKWLCSNAGKSADMQEEAMRLFITTQNCRREQLGAVMDRQGRKCEESGGERCDRCPQASWPLEENGGPEENRRDDGAEAGADRSGWQKERYANGVKLWQDRVRSRGLERERIERAVGEIGEGCAAC